MVLIISKNFRIPEGLTLRTRSESTWRLSVSINNSAPFLLSSLSSRDDRQVRFMFFCKEEKAAVGAAFITPAFGFSHCAMIRQAGVMNAAPTAGFLLQKSEPHP